jgi:hypothetical protein
VIDGTDEWEVQEILACKKQWNKLFYGWGRL